MFRRHQLLLPFMVAVEVLVRGGKMTPEECELLTTDLSSAETQLDFRLREKTSCGSDIPAWIPRKVCGTILASPCPYQFSNVPRLCILSFPDPMSMLIDGDWGLGMRLQTLPPF